MKRRPTDPVSDSGRVQGYRSYWGWVGGKAFLNCLVLMRNFVMHRLGAG